MPRLGCRRDPAGFHRPAANPPEALACPKEPGGIVGKEDVSAARLKELAAHGKRLRLVEFSPGFADPHWGRKRPVSRGRGAPAPKRRAARTRSAGSGRGRSG